MMMNREIYILRLAEKIMTNKSTETYPAEEIAEAREYLLTLGIETVKKNAMGASA